MINRILFFIAVTGWSLAITFHLLALLDVDVETHFPFVWLLHVGIFVVWLPAVLKLRKMKESEGVNMGTFNGLSIFKPIMATTPKWILMLAGAGFVYAGINFTLFIFSQHGTPSVRDGQYILHNHGHIIKVLTAAEYAHYKANEVRGFSGHWIAFYGIAAAVLFPFRKGPINANQTAVDKI
jgi:hypothetical protein